ncbi:hypothetical protein G7Y79_00019g046120 [Physcia stellaris]|nr:hypothetical protein G7Y79_00019g046120 [Physcia stellaris]
MDQEEEYTIPLQDQRVFGAGIKRKRIAFVPAATSPTASTRIPPLHQNRRTTLPIHTVPDPPTPATPTATNEDALCEICSLPVTSVLDTATGDRKPHETSLVHQVCLAHSHPPSHLDRNRAGVKYLSSYGWDLDGRLGLGAKGEGVRVPIKAKLKNDTVGLGVERAISKGQVVAKKVERLDAKGVRRKELEGKKREKRLQQMFYGADDVEKYLGTEG